MNKILNTYIIYYLQIVCIQYIYIHTKYYKLDLHSYLLIVNNNNCNYLLI